MTDYQEEKLSMYEKVLLFLITFATDLLSVTQIAVIQADLDANITGITDAESIASEDTTGFTMQKANARAQLQEITMKVSQATAAYFLSINNPGGFKLSDYTASELANARDNDLYAKAKKLYNIANPISASLVNFNSSPADVTALNTDKETFFDIIQLPAAKRGEKSASGKDVDKLMSETDGLLDGLDIYMNTFSDNTNLFNQYKSARAIDITGGGGGSNNAEREGDVIGATVIYIDLTGVTPTPASEAVIEITGNAVQLYASAAPNLAYVPGSPLFDVAIGTVTKTLAEFATLTGLNTSGDFLNIRNVGVGPSHFKITFTNVE